MGLDWDPRTAGSLADRSPGIDNDLVMEAITDQFRRRFRLVERDLPKGIVEQAAELVDDHLPKVA